MWSVLVEELDHVGVGRELRQKILDKDIGNDVVVEKPMFNRDQSFDDGHGLGGHGRVSEFEI